MHSSAELDRNVIVYMSSNLHHGRFYETQYRTVVFNPPPPPHQPQPHPQFEKFPLFSIISILIYYVDNISFVFDMLANI